MIFGARNIFTEGKILALYLVRFVRTNDFRAHREQILGTIEMQVRFLDETGGRIFNTKGRLGRMYAPRQPGL